MRTLLLFLLLAFLGCKDKEQPCVNFKVGELVYINHYPMIIVSDTKKYIVRPVLGGEDMVVNCKNLSRQPKY